MEERVHVRLTTRWTVVLKVPALGKQHDSLEDETDDKNQERACVQGQLLEVQLMLFVLEFPCDLNDCVKQHQS